MSELRKKRQSLESDFGGKKFLRRSEIEEKKIQKIREEEQREAQAKALRQNPPSSSSLSAASASSSSSDQNPSSKSSLPPALASLAAPSSSKKHSEFLSEEQRIDDLVLSRPEVIRHLRVLKQPITLFGEDDDARLERLKVILKSGILEIDSDITEGQTNDFLRDIYEMRKRQKAGSFLRETKHKRDDSDGLEGTGVEDGNEGLGGNGASSGPDADKDLKSMKTNFEELCDEDKILVFFKRLLNEWNQELDEMPESEKRTAKGKSMVATFNQCARYLNPLFKFCGKKVRISHFYSNLLVFSLFRTLLKCHLSG